jgi:hypothetical protein
MLVTSAESAIVIAGHSRPKDGVASLAYDPAIHDDSPRVAAESFVTAARTAWMPGSSPGMTAERLTDANGAASAARLATPLRSKSLHA